MSHRHFMHVTNAWNHLFTASSPSTAQTWRNMAMENSSMSQGDSSDFPLPTLIYFGQTTTFQISGNKHQQASNQQFRSFSNDSDCFFPKSQGDPNLQWGPSRSPGTPLPLFSPPSLSPSAPASRPPGCVEATQWPQRSLGFFRVSWRFLFLFPQIGVPLNHPSHGWLWMTMVYGDFWINHFKKPLKWRLQTFFHLNC